MIKLIYIISSIGIGLLGFFIFLFVIYRSRKLKSIESNKPKAIEHYEEVRDKLTIREPEKKEDKELFDAPFGLLSIQSLFSIIISFALLIFVVLIIINSINNNLNNSINSTQIMQLTSNISSSLSSSLISTSSLFGMMGMVIIIFVVIIVIKTTLDFRDNFNI